MSCGNEQDLISSLLDGQGLASQKAAVHLTSCTSCKTRFQAAKNLRDTMRTMDRVEVPVALSARLQVIASHERDRLLKRSTLADRWREWMGRVRLAFDNMAKPYALPFAGGMVSALLLLGLWVPSVSSAVASDDVPLPYWVYTGPSARAVNQLSSGDAVVELTIDERGRVADCFVTHGELSPEITGSILVMRFTPATFFGKPARGKLVISLSQISVRG